MSPNQARPIKRRRRTQAEVEQLEEQILEALEEDHPQSIRHVFYLMTNPRLPEPVVKTQNGYNQVQHRLTVMRREGRVPYGWISDSTRRGYHTVTYRNAADFLRRWHGHYRADLWRDARVYVEVWCESRSLAGVIKNTCRELAVSLYPAGGFTSITLAFEAAEFINETTGHGEVPAHVLYVGDYDPAGVLIDQSIDNELREHLNSDVELHFHRLAVTPGQIRDMDLPSKPRKPGERRAQHIQETVEAEAMPARDMKRVLREAIETFLPGGALEAARAAEESERSQILRLADLAGVA